MRSRLIRTACAVIAFSWTANLAFSAKPDKQSPAPQVKPDDREAVRLVQRALEAEAAGDADTRLSLLKQALIVAPDYAPIHWHLGELLVDSKWLPIDSATRQTSQRETIIEYNNRRIAVGQSAVAQLELARWCRAQGLVEQHRAHALLALAADPGLTVAKVELDLRNVNGLWLTPAELAERKLQAEEEKKAFARWKPELTRLARLAKKSDAAREQLCAICDPTAIPAIERILSSENEQTALWAVVMLSNMQEQPATESLVRHAVLSKWEDVRLKAAEALQPRSIYSYAPLLLAGLQAPLEVEFNFTDETMTNGIGSWRYYCGVFREGPTINTAWDVFSTVHVGGTVIEDRRPPGGPGRSVRLMPANAEVMIDRTLPQRTAAAVEILNRSTRAANDRIGRALYIAIPRSDPLAVSESGDQKHKTVRPPDESNSASPSEWWKWWYDYNEIHYPSERPTRQYSLVDERRYARDRIVICSCFIAGTPVWTPVGPLAIDRVQPGDLVLAQHPETGELAFKAVLGTTVRPPSPMIRIELGPNQIVATRGHPLWVSGKGWRMAKELAVGDQLHTATGPMEITAIEPGPKEPAYNLVVDEFNTYCVGDDRVLAHDNNLRRPTGAPVPGL